jgi:hypothetical protein
MADPNETPQALATQVQELRDLITQQHDTVAKQQT